MALLESNLFRVDQLLVLRSASNRTLFYISYFSTDVEQIFDSRFSRQDRRFHSLTRQDLDPDKRYAPIRLANLTYLHKNWNLVRCAIFIVVDESMNQGRINSLTINSTNEININMGEAGRELHSRTRSLEIGSLSSRNSRGVKVSLPAKHILYRKKRLTPYLDHRWRNKIQSERGRYPPISRPTRTARSSRNGWHG